MLTECSAELFDFAPVERRAAAAEFDAPIRVRNDAMSRRNQSVHFDYLDRG